MSLLGTLGKVAMGIMVAKTVGKAMGGSGGLLGNLLGGKGAAPTQGGGMGDLLNNLGAGTQTSGNAGGGLGDLLSSALQGKQVSVTPDEEQKAMILLKAMIQAAKADGEIDADERAKITQQIGDVTQEEIAFVKKEMDAPLDVNALVRATPKEMAQQVYMMSLLAINLDNSDEAHYLDQLAQGLGISHQVANAIHQKVGAQPIYNS